MLYIRFINLLFLDIYINKVIYPSDEETSDDESPTAEPQMMQMPRSIYVTKVYCFS